MIFIKIFALQLPLNTKLQNTVIINSFQLKIIKKILNTSNEMVNKKKKT